MKSIFNLLVTLTLGLCSSSVFANSTVIPVIDATISSSHQANTYSNVNNKPTPSAPKNSASRMNSSLVELLYQLELLQQEVRQLRGTVEQQSWQIKQMGLEQKDRYIDLDRRIVLLSQSTPQNLNQQAPLSATNTSATISANNIDVPTDKTVYQAAFELIRNKRYDESIIALTQFIKKYPNSNLVGNAHYWLGEVQLVKANFTAAAATFNTLLTKYPTHRKVPDTKYKLGRAYRELGDTIRAKKLLQDVISNYAGTSTAKLAEAELRNNF